jgi:hypothetical protein
MYEADLGNVLDRKGQDLGKPGGDNPSDAGVASRIHRGTISRLVPNARGDVAPFSVQCPLATHNCR